LLDYDHPGIYGFYGMCNRETAIEVVAKRAGGTPIIAVVLLGPRFVPQTRSGSHDLRFNKTLDGERDEISPKKSA
jgi:hypothetical protein